MSHFRIKLYFRFPVPSNPRNTDSVTSISMFSFNFNVSIKLISSSSIKTVLCIEAFYAWNCIVHYKVDFYYVLLVLSFIHRLAYLKSNQGQNRFQEQKQNNLNIGPHTVIHEWEAMYLLVRKFRRFKPLDERQICLTKRCCKHNTAGFTLKHWSDRNNTQIQLNKTLLRNDSKLVNSGQPIWVF